MSTTPSKALDAIVAELASKLGPAVNVRKLGALFAADVDKLVTLPSPGVYLALLRSPTNERDYDPPAIDGRFMALVLARESRPDREEATRDDVAMNLAALVQATIERSRFGGAFVRPPYNLAGTNSWTPDFHRKGVSVWRVEWSQPFELDREAVQTELVKLREIRMTAEMGGILTDDVGGNAGPWT